MANHESTPEDPDIPYKKLVDRIDQEEGKLRLVDQYTQNATNDRSSHTTSTYESTTM